MTDEELRLLIVLHALRMAFNQLALDTENGAVTIDDARQRAHELLVDWRRALTPFQIMPPSPAVPGSPPQPG